MNLSQTAAWCTTVMDYIKCTAELWCTRWFLWATSESKQDLTWGDLFSQRGDPLPNKVQPRDCQKPKNPKEYLRKPNIAG